jgi:hypothetical protein
MLIKLLERATFASTWSPLSLYIDQSLHKMTWVASRMFLIFSMGWDGLLPLVLLVTLCLDHGDISTVTTIISPLLESAMPSLAQDVKPNCKPICTKLLNYYHLTPTPKVDLSLRPYVTILVQINPNLQSCVIKAVIILTSIPYQIPKILKSNIFKIIGIKILCPLYTYKPIICFGRSSPIFRGAKSSYSSRPNTQQIHSYGLKSDNSNTNCNASRIN